MARDAPSRAQARGLLGPHSPAHTHTDMPRASDNHRPHSSHRKRNAQHFDEVEDERERVRGHGQPARCDAGVRAPVEAPEPQLGVVLEEDVSGLLCRRERAEDWYNGFSKARGWERERERSDSLRVIISSMSDTP